ncbi:MAG TPA: hypothetical protein VN673_13155 [Clostridia bacterium]|nr:hypothetical protein [Clostridia bacterium]
MGAAAFGLLAYPLSAWEKPRVHASGARLNGARIALFDGTQVSVLIKVDRAYPDYQKRGFFRIGVLPIAVLEGVSAELCRPTMLSRDIELAAGWFSEQERKRLIIRDLIISAGSNDFVSALSARLVDNKRLRLTGNVRVFLSGVEHQAETAFLCMTGEKAGQVVFESSGFEAFDLFRDRAPAELRKEPYENQPRNHPLSASGGSRSKRRTDR